MPSEPISIDELIDSSGGEGELPLSPQVVEKVLSPSRGERVIRAAGNAPAPILTRGITLSHRELEDQKSN